MKPKGDGGVWGSYLVYMERLEAVEDAARAYLAHPHDINFDVLSAALEGLNVYMDADIDIYLPP